MRRWDDNVRCIDSLPSRLALARSRGTRASGSPRLDDRRLTTTRRNYDVVIAVASWRRACREKLRANDDKHARRPRPTTTTAAAAAATAVRGRLQTTTPEDGSKDSGICDWHRAHPPYFSDTRSNEHSGFSYDSY